MRRSSGECRPCRPCHRRTSPFLPHDFQATEKLGQSIAQASTFRLIEFKRASNRDPKEARKLEDLQREIHGDPRRDTLMRTSCQIHRLVVIQHVGSSTNQIRTTLTERAYVGGTSTVSTIPELCAATATALMNPANSPTVNECEHYVRLLARISAGAKRPSGGGGTLLVAVRDGIIEHAHVNDLSDIFRTQEQLRKLEVIRELQSHKAMDAQREQAPVREKSARGDDFER